jgi:hypothetical protein
MHCVPSQLDENGLHVELSLPVGEARHFGRINLGEVRCIQKTFHAVDLPCRFSGQRRVGSLSKRIGWLVESQGSYRRNVY